MRQEIKFFEAPYPYDMSIKHINEHLRSMCES